MTLFGYKEAHVAALVRAVAPDESVERLDREGIASLFARAVWTGIGEPGDRVMVRLVAALGAARALTVVIEKHPADAVFGELRERDVDDLEEDDLSEAFRRWHPRIDSVAAVRALRQGERFGLRLVTPGCGAWPAALDDLGEHAPVALWVRGRYGALADLRHSVALVGARAATGYGEHVTMELSAGLVDRGHPVVSGGAYGIDGMAHRAALASEGTTVAFLAGGLDRFYPSGHESLLERISGTGATVAEVPCGVPPTKWRFLQRNRLIAAASAATVVVEAGWRSGSLNTAGHAAALGRPLGAVPGPVTSAASAGCHRLLREYGAACVTNPDEVAELVTGLSAAGEAPGHGPTSEELRVLDALSPRSPRSSGDVAARAGLAPEAARAVLGALELAQSVRATERGWVRASATQR